ncbi:hypothetical protein HaLaN_06112 [Haematococcus lacustris]|uniref:Uncharacterized protein n=1 Tax=Haematococcus lacustris TaxID=44745 RepID=A0A699YKY3_HAELA|nr:hypothetical protein HaLaN_06112 [Haematococcus lacustris]
MHWWCCAAGGVLRLEEDTGAAPGIDTTLALFQVSAGVIGPAECDSRLGLLPGALAECDGVLSVGRVSASSAECTTDEWVECLDRWWVLGGCWESVDSVEGSFDMAEWFGGTREEFGSVARPKRWHRGAGSQVVGRWARVQKVSVRVIEQEFGLRPKRWHRGARSQGTERGWAGDMVLLMHPVDPALAALLVLLILGCSGVQGCGPKLRGTGHRRAATAAIVVFLTYLNMFTQTISISAILAFMPPPAYPGSRQQ